MSDIAGVLKSEIVRLAKKVSREQTATLQTASVAQKKQIAALKSQVNTLTREIKDLKRAASKALTTPPKDVTAQPRFSAKGFASLRARFGLSAERMGKLLGVGGQWVYNLENGSTPSADTVKAIAELRPLGKRAVLKRLEQIEAEAKTPKGATKKRKANIAN